MIVEHSEQNNQLPKELKSVFSELDIAKLKFRQKNSILLHLSFSALLA
jgi:hypothetical protein